MAQLWESELLRARQWLAAQRQERRQQRDQVFANVTSHLRFVDHRQSLQSAVVASEDEDEHALDFLGDVDVSDMAALLRAEASKPPAVEPANHMPTAAELMRPLEMPAGLASPKSKPKTVAVPMSQLKPKTGATLGDDAAVRELMQDLDVHVHSDVEEHKTEDSTPPQLAKRGSSGMQKLGRLASHGVGAARPDPNKYMQQATTKSPTEPEKKLATAVSKPDPIAAEMESWVTGYRDPAVIRRKESMTRKRKAPHLFGVSSEEERRQALLALKQITQRSSSSESDTNSEGDFSSDYTPAEEEEPPEPDEPEVIELLSDDYLDSDGEKKPKRKRKRLRQTHTTTARKKKKVRSRKPAVTRKLSQEDTSSQQSKEEQDRVDTTLHGTPGNARKDKNDENLSSVAKPGGITGNVSATNNLMTDNDEGGTENEHALEEPAGHAGMQATKEIAGLSPSKRDIPAVMVSTKAATPMTETKARDDPSDKGAVNDILAHLLAQKAGDDPELSDTGTIDAEGDDPELSDTGTIDAEENNDGELSDTGTVDLEGEDLSEKQSSIGGAAVSGSGAGGSSKQPALDEKPTSESGKTLPLATDTVEVSSAEPKKAPRTESKLDSAEAPKPTPDATNHADADDADVSEAETEVLEEDDVASDDLGLDYSDDSDSGKNVSGHGNEGANSQKQKSADDNQENSGTKQNSSADKKEDGTSTKKPGVEQFFQFAPLTLKSKAKPTTTRKPLPIHKYSDTHLKKNDEPATAPPKKHLVTPPKPSAGSNGLRPSKKPIATTTSMKGKYAVTRRSTKLLSPQDTPGAKSHQQKSQYTMVPTKKSTQNGGMSLLEKEMARNAESGSKSDARYLSYNGVKKTEDARLPAEAPRNTSKSRYGGGTEGLHNSPSTSNGSTAQEIGSAKRNGYRREAQISIYDALHMDGQENAVDIRDGAGYKRPSKFKKMQAEAAEKGTPKARPNRFSNTDWDKVPIPKKKKQAPPPAPIEQHSHTPARKTSDSYDHGASKSSKKNRKNGYAPKKNTGPSYYGPSASQAAARDKYDSPSRDRRGNNFRHDDDRRKRSPSPRSRDRDRYPRDNRNRDDHRRRSRSRSYSRSRSRSPRGRDYSSSRHRRRSHSRSRSRSWSKEKPSGQDRRHSDPPPSSTGRDTKRGRDSVPARDPPEQGEIQQTGGNKDPRKEHPTAPSWTPKKQKTSHASEESPPPGALATFDDNDGDIFISDSDDDISTVIKEVEDIRFSLEDVPVDEELMARQVYVTGFNPTICAEQIEEDFAPFGVAVDRDTGFPAIDIFPCQRNHLGRGDACVTFETEKGAQTAVEELNSKNIKNSMIRVRRMDVHTQRILTVQFKTVRDTWKCTGTQCRADVSIWNGKCDKCGRKRVYGPSNIKIGEESWLCSVCFTANDPFTTSCHGCMESLPEVDRAAFYST